MADSGHMKVYPRDWILQARILQRPSPGSGADSIKAYADLIYGLHRQKLEALTQSRREVVELFTTDRCTTVGFAEHFGAELPGGQKRCERCDWCLTGKPAVLHPEQPEKEIDLKKIRAVLRAIPDRDNPRFLARVAAGVGSGRVIDRNLHKLPVYRSMREVNFDVSPCSTYHIA